MATTYQNLINVNGTIYDKSTGRGYATPEELARDLGVQTVLWGNIKQGSLTDLPLTPEIRIQIAEKFGLVVNGVPINIAGNTVAEVLQNATQTSQRNSGSQINSQQAFDALGITPQGTNANYANLINDNGTIYNKATGKGYATPQELAADLGISANQIQWDKIQAGTLQQAQKDKDRINPPQPTTGDPTYDQLFSELVALVKELRNRGQVLNPNIELTPQQIAEFTAKAEGEINPFYSSQLKLARETLLRSQGFTTDDVLRQEQDLERKYGTSVRRLGESAAEQGFALSGLRQRDETELAQETQSSIDTNRRNLGFQAGSQALAFAQQYGARELPQTNIQEAPRVVAGQSTFQRPTGSSAFYNISPSIVDGLVGSQEYERRGAVASRSSQLEEAQRTLEGVRQQRTLTI